MRYLMLDIETAPLEIEHEDVKKYLMDKKIGESRKLNPSYAKIILICVKFLNGNYKEFEGSEKELLDNFWEFIKENKDAKIITHNGYGFDIPFLNIRSCVNNVNIPVKINMNRWAMESSNHFDTMLFFSSQSTFTNPALEILAKLNNIEIEGELIDGRDIEKLYKEGNFEKIKGKCKRDVEILEKVFEKLCWGYLNKRV